MTPTRRSRTLLVVASLLSVSFVGAAIGPRPALADEDSADVGKITLLNRKAMEEYQNLNFDEAQRLLKEALEVASRANLAQHPIRARTYLNLGIVTLVGFRQRDQAIRHFRKALQIDPEINLSRAMASPEAKDAFEEAVKGLGSQSSEIPAEELLLHDPVQTGSRGQPITMVAFPQEGLATATLVLAYRPEGSAVFSEVKMQRKPSGAFEGVVPAQATSGGRLAYYIVAARADGKAIASRGSAESPLMVMLSGAGSDPEVIKKELTPAPAAGAGDSKFVFGLLFGTGGGWVAGSGESTRTDVGSGGFAWALAGHVAPELGYWATPQLMLAVQGRFQLVTGATDYKLPDALPGECGGDGICSPAKGAFAGFLKAAWFFTERSQAFRPYASLALGGGTIRHVMRFEGKVSCGPMGKDTCVDTVAVGPLLFGAGVGFHYLFSDRVGVAVGVDAIVGAPTPQLHLDGNLGLVFLL